MKTATPSVLTELETLCANKRKTILSSPDRIDIKGTTYYVSEQGDDTADGKSPETAWRTLARVSAAELHPGDGVLFCRGETFRGFVKAQSGVTYAAYGMGDKPRLLGWDKNLSDPSLWTLFDETHAIWMLKDPILDCGTLVMNEGEEHCRKLIPSYIGGQFVCREEPSRLFDMTVDMTHDLDLFCRCESEITTRESRGETTPVPLVNDHAYGTLYLRCDRGNPGTVFASIEALPARSMFQVGENANVRLDNLCLKYIGAHGVASVGHVVGLHVTNCEIGWIGGVVQHYLGLDPNNPSCTRGMVTRFGNGVEIYGGCEDYVVDNCLIYQVYDAGVTHQVSTAWRHVVMKNIRYTNNLIENCVYSIEYFLDREPGDSESYMEDYEISGNILRRSGYGWGQQRPNIDTPAHIKGWSYENTAHNYRIQNNIFDRAAYRMLHLVAKKPESLPRLEGNTYLQEMGMPLGQYGANETEEPPILVFDEDAEETVKTVFGDKTATVYHT